MMIRIRSKKAGFRRCGIAHSDQWTDYPDATFTPEQVAILKAEPMLQVLVEGEAAKSGTARELDAMLERLEELESQRNGLQDALARASMDKDILQSENARLKAEIEQLKANPDLAQADQSKPKNRRETA